MNILVCGGARSGKSQFAESLYTNDNVTYICTYVNDGQDLEMVSRIKKHRDQRNPKWKTVETDVTLNVASEFVLMDCVSIFVSNVLFKYTHGVEYIDDILINKIESDLHTQLTHLLNQSNHIVFVSNEVGSSLVPQTQLERVYRDILGRINCWLAQRVNVVYFIVCGQPIKIKG